MDTKHLINFWTEKIQKDLTPFIDPNSELNLESSGRVISASWLQRSEPRRADFSLSLESGTRVTFKSENLDYRSFFASPSMADLLGLAKATLQLIKSTSAFVETKAELAYETDSIPLPATELLTNLIRQSATNDFTSVVMVTGEAGAGKTSVLKKLVAQQARAYTLGKSEALLLYVNAQGRALARFHEAMATELQDLRVLLTYHSISTLVRLGLIVPVIDGFDELLGAGGYDDAFSSLSQFIDELDGYGCIIASARSTYYEQEFVSRTYHNASQGTQAWKQIPVRVRAWDDEEFREYINCISSSDPSRPDAGMLLEEVTQIFDGPNLPLRNKPLFVSRVVDLYLKKTVLSGQGNLLQRVIDASVERERNEKLLNDSEVPLLTALEIKSLLADVAEEMWNQETRELDQRSAKDIAEIALLDIDLNDKGKRIVAERMPTMAFLNPGEKSGSIAFEHELFFYYFLSLRIAEKICSELGVSPLLLSRSLMPKELADMIWREVKRLNQVVQPATVLAALAKAGDRHTSRTAQVRENAGLIAASVLEDYAASGQPLDGLALTNLTFPGGSLCGVHLREAIFRDVEFRRTDLTGAEILSSTATRVRFYEVTINIASTNLDISGLDIASDFVGLRWFDNSDAHETYDPHKIQSVLRKVGVRIPGDDETVSARKVSGNVIAMLDRFLRAYSRVNPICTEDKALRGLFSKNEWPALKGALIESGVITSEHRETGGSRKEFLRRRFLPNDIMFGSIRDNLVQPAVANLWEMLEERFPDSQS